MPSYTTTWEPWYLSSGRCNRCTEDGAQSPVRSTLAPLERGGGVFMSPAPKKVKSNARFEPVAERFLVDNFSQGRTYLKSRGSGLQPWPFDF